jgi:methylmalonyl-CoA mutase
VIASGFADLGFEVDVGSLFSTPAETAAAAIQARVVSVFLRAVC